MVQITINTIDAKEQLSDLINQVAHHKERVIFTRRGKEIAVLISMEDFKLLLATQDKIDLREATESLKEAREKGPITLEELKEEVGT
jgi:prevent-host-death family protein